METAIEKDQFNESKARDVFKKRRSESTPDQIARSYNNTPKEDSDRARNAFRKREAKESWGKSILRTILQIPQGIAEGTVPGILAGLSQMIAMGESLDPEDIDNLKRISEREGIPFNEELYLKAVQNASKYSPSVSGLANLVEYETGLPLEAKTGAQKFTRFASTAGKLIPSELQTIPQRAITGAGVSGAEKLLEENFPEAVAQPLSLALLGPVGLAQAGSKSPSIGPKTKPSGLTERQFENVKAPREVSANRIEKINKKLEDEFKNLTKVVIEQSPIGETAQSLKNDPTFKQSSRELMAEAQEIANTIPQTISKQALQEEYANFTTKKVKGFSLNEYDEAYLKYMKEASDKILPANIKAGEAVQNYRKNNESLGEYFEPGSSKAVNRAKRDSLLDQNRAIVAVMEKVYPDSPLVPVFKEGNARWTKIMDAEAVDEFITDIFSGDRINYKKVHDFFDKPGYSRIFKRALGEDGFKQFEQLLKDTLSTEVPYKMLKVAKAKGFNDLYKTALSYMIHPKLGHLKAGVDVAKYSYRQLINAMLDKPKIAFIMGRGVKNLKKGNFKAAENDFKEVKAEVEVLPKEDVGEPSNAKTQETEVDITPKKTTSESKEIGGVERKRITHKEKESEKELPPFLIPEAQEKLTPKQLSEGFKEFLSEKSIQWKKNKLKELIKRDKELSKPAEKGESQAKIDSLRESNKERINDLQEDLGLNKKQPSIKSPRKTKIQALEESLKRAQKNNDLRGKKYSDLYHSRKLVKNKLGYTELEPWTKAQEKIATVRKKQWQAAEKRVNEIHEEIERLKMIEKENQYNKKKKS